jgi:hypothetical protein
MKTIWSIQLKETASLQDVTCIINALNLTSDNENIIKKLTSDGFLIQKIEVSDVKSGDKNEESEDIRKSDS